MPSLRFQPLTSTTLTDLMHGQVCYLFKVLQFHLMPNVVMVYANMKRPPDPCLIVFTFFYRLRAPDFTLKLNLDLWDYLTLINSPFCTSRYE